MSELPLSESRDAVSDLDHAAGGSAQGTSGEIAQAEPLSDDATGMGCPAADEVKGKAEAQKTRPATVREFEHAMRALGFSKREAETIAKSGFKALNDSPEPEVDPEQIAELLAALKRRGSVFQKV